jgi:hypothetical protein
VAAEGAVPLPSPAAMPTLPPVTAGSEIRQHEQHRLNLETWFRGIALMLVVVAIVFYPLYALIFRIPGTTLADIVAPVTGIAGAVVGYWFGQASRRIPTNPPSSGNGNSGGGQATGQKRPDG